MCPKGLAASSPRTCCGRQPGPCSGLAAAAMHKHGGLSTLRNRCSAAASARPSSTSTTASLPAAILICACKEGNRHVTPKRALELNIFI